MINILLIILLILLFVLIYKNNSFEGFVNKPLSRHDQLEYAYKLCSKTSGSPDCRRFVILYDSMNNHFNKIKKKYCKKFPSQCKDIL